MRLNDIYFNHQDKRTAEEPLVDSLCRSRPPQVALYLETYPSTDGSICFARSSDSNTPFSVSFDGRSQQHRWKQQNHQGIDDSIGSFTLLLFDELSPPTSVGPSTAEHTQGLAVAAQAAMDEVTGRITPYAESGVPAFGVYSMPFDGLDPFNLGGVTTPNMLPYQAFGGVDCTSVCCSLYFRSQNGNPNILLSAARLSYGYNGAAIRHRE